MNRERRIQHWQWVTFYLALYDAVAVSLSFFIALWLRFDLDFDQIPSEYLGAWMKVAPFYAIFCISIFALFKLYRSIWRFASFTELQRISAATILTVLVHIVIITLLFGRMPASYYVIGTMLQFILTVGIRFSYRIVLLLRSRYGETDKHSRCMLIGAGAAGTVILREMRHSKSISDRIVCIIDDNKNKWNRDVEGVPVVGGRESIINAVSKFNVEKIYIAIPSASALEKKKIIDICNETECELKTLPGVYQLMLGNVTVNSLRNVEVEDLLGREPVKMGSKEVRKLIKGKTVLVTGTGSIGSELCRQIADIEGINRLILFDIYENNAHEIKLELEDSHPDLELITLIGSVRNSNRVRKIFKEYRPNIVFHAAAHKHVPLMEDSPCEAIKNNVVGTYHVAFAATVYGCEKFVLISTDKAVNPVNVMGASKRICEMIIQAFAKKIANGTVGDLPDIGVNLHMAQDKSMRDYIEDGEKPITEFSAVRFGNVLGSNGSVIPRFKEQIAAGGPVTVTHPEIVRYFMTIPEAVSLVLNAATFGGGGRIFVLDMGTEVKIDDLARNMIKLSGLIPDKDIEIVYTGLRPGEKLYEEKLMEEEGLQKTSNDLIHIGSPIEFDEGVFVSQLQELIVAAYLDKDDIREIIADIVSTYIYGRKCEDITKDKLNKTNEASEKIIN